jgi:ATP-binding cassette subfamily B protein RaxB
MLKLIFGETYVALERAVNASIAALNITRIIVAHRPETIASAGRLIALQSGQVVHDAVIAKPAGAGTASAAVI